MAPAVGDTYRLSMVEERSCISCILPYQWIKSYPAQTLQISLIILSPIIHTFNPSLKHSMRPLQLDWSFRVIWVHWGNKTRGWSAPPEKRLSGSQPLHYRAVCLHQTHSYLSFHMHSKVGWKTVSKEQRKAKKGRKAQQEDKLEAGAVAQ